MLFIAFLVFEEFCQVLRNFVGFLVYRVFLVLSLDF